MVPFRGATSGEADLTWGQREIWIAMQTQQSWLPIFWIEELPAITSVDAVVERLRTLLCRYDSMHTRLVFTDDGEPRQSVAASGEIPLDIFEAGDCDPAEVAAQVVAGYRDAPYDFTTDWPVRTGLVLRDGVPSHLASVCCHLVMDGLARPLMLRDLGDPANPVDPADLADPVDPAPAPVALQPIELARWEQSETARKAGAVCLAYWEKMLRDIPARRFPAVPTPGPGPRYWEAVYSSRAMALALRVLSPRAPAATAPLLALFALALHRVTGTDPVVAQLVVGNRFRTHLAEVFAPVNQSGLWVLPVGGSSVEDALGLSRRRVTSAIKHAYYDPRLRRDLIERVGRERGEDIDIGCFINDRRLSARAAAGGAPAHVPSLAAIESARAETAFAWRTRTDKPSEPLFVNVEDVPDTVHLTAWVDTHYLAPQRLEGVLRELETIAVEATTSTMVGLGA
jgi:hypothetical protein